MKRAGYAVFCRMIALPLAGLLAPLALAEPSCRQPQALPSCMNYLPLERRLEEDGTWRTRSYRLVNQCGRDIKVSEDTTNDDKSYIVRAGEQSERELSMIDWYLRNKSYDAIGCCATGGYTCEHGQEQKIDE